MKKIFCLLFTAIFLNGFSQQAVITAVSPNPTCPWVNFVLSSSASIPGGSPIINSVWSIMGPNGFTYIGQTVPGVDFTVYLSEIGFYSVSLINQHFNGTSSSVQQLDFIHAYVPSAEHEVLQGVSICGEAFGFNMNNLVGVTSWSWDLGDGTIITDADEPDHNFNHTYQEVRTYYLSLMLVGGSNCFVSYEDTITVAPNGVDAFFTATPDNGIGSGTNVTFDDASSSLGGNLALWIWDFGDGNIDTFFNANTFDHQYSSAGLKMVTLTVYNTSGCSDQYQTFLNYLGITSNENAQEIHLYPNPVSDLLHIKTAGLNPLVIELFDLHGKQLDKHLYSLSASEVDVSRLETGVYFLKITDETTTHTSKFQKM